MQYEKGRCESQYQFLGNSQFFVEEYLLLPDSSGKFLFELCICLVQPFNSVYKGVSWAFLAVSFHNDLRQAYLGVPYGVSGNFDMLVVVQLSLERIAKGVVSALYFNHQFAFFIVENFYFHFPGIVGFQPYLKTFCCLILPFLLVFVDDKIYFCASILRQLTSIL